MVTQQSGSAGRIRLVPSGGGTSDRAGLMRRAYEYYIGQPPDALRRRTSEPDDNVKISLGRSLVDTGVAFLFGEEVTSQLTADKSQRAQDWLDECWRRNKRMLTLQKIAQNGGVCGHTFAKIVPEAFRSGGVTYPRVVVLDPERMDVVTDDDDCDTVLQYIYSYPTLPGESDEDAPQRRQVVQRGDDETSWIILDQHHIGNDQWVTDLNTPWPWDFAPIVDCQNLPRPNDFWGESDLPDDICNLLRAINRVASHHNKIIRVHAHPKVWARGMGTRTLDTAIDAVIQMPSETAELRSLEMQSDLHATANFLTELKDNLAIVARVPLVALGVPDRQGAISGVALQIRFRPLVQKTLAKRLTYGDLLQELDRRLLALGGFGEYHLTQLDWPEMLPEDPLAERQTLVLDDGLGIVSKETLATKLGYDWEVEQKNKEAERLAAPPLPVAVAPAAGTPPGAGADPAQPVPPPAPFKAPVPDVATRAKSR